jgi:ATP-binding cassette subfamily B protein
MKNYALNKPSGPPAKTSTLGALRKMLPMLGTEKGMLLFALAAILVNTGINLTAPYLIGRAIDLYIRTSDYGGVLRYAGILFVIFLVGLVCSYLQISAMGGVGQRVLYKLRNAVFQKLQDLPVAFFNQNKAGDLISRINNDTDKLNQFFSQALMQFMGNFFLIIGSSIFLLVIHPRLGAAALAPAVVLLVFTQSVSAWVRRRNLASLQATGGLSAEIQESLTNFKVIVAFNRRDYFREKFAEANELNYKGAVSAGVASNIFVPVYGLCSNIAQLVVLAYGIALIASGAFTVGLLISYIAYVNRFYDPLRQIASFWASFQAALAGWDRISAILAMESDMEILPAGEAEAGAPLLEFRDVTFGYPEGKTVLGNINFALEAGKTYALVGPTGGGKTTTASLMARLYDPTQGTVLLEGRDIRSYVPAERTQKIGFILQEPFLFTGTVRENIIYGNDAYAGHSPEELTKTLHNAGLDGLLQRFEQGLETPVTSGGETISIGQRQLIAFIRAVLRNPDLLILDEATANIDTVTEQLLEEILRKLPATTTKVIIAHRLNTIESANEIFFVNAGEIVKAGSLEHAVEMLLHDKRGS